MKGFLLLVCLREENFSLREDNFSLDEDNFSLDEEKIILFMKIATLMLSPALLKTKL